MLSEWHRRAGARYVEVKGVAVPGDYGDIPGEYAGLTAGVGVMDLSGRGRVCVVGADRQRFLNGQLTNDIGGLKSGQGCSAAVATAKGRIESDLGVVVLDDEILLDFEPGLTSRVMERLERYVIADDVQLVDVGTECALLSVQGPAQERVAGAMGWGDSIPGEAFGSCACAWRGTPKSASPASASEDGAMVVPEVILIRRNRFGLSGFDVVVPAGIATAVWERLNAAAAGCGGRAVGWQACEVARVENGVPRYGADMGEANLVPETGLEGALISYSKGCYIGQEVIARIRTYGQVTRALRRLEFGAEVTAPPVTGAKLRLGEREVGWVTSAVGSLRTGRVVGLGYVRKECHAVGQELVFETTAGVGTVRVSGLPVAGV